MSPNEDLKMKGDLAEVRANNFDFLRFFAALLVIFSHSYAISRGPHGHDPIAVASRGQLDFGNLAVCIFFIISGFLITASWYRSRSASSFFWKRFLRIFPGLVIIVLLTIFVLGPIVTTASTSHYFRNPATYGYLRTILLRNHWAHDSLPGVFVHNALPGSVNGSLWTLFYEIACYAFVGVLGMIGLLKKPVVLLTFVASIVSRPIALALNPSTNFLGGESLQLVQMFLAGMLFYFFRDRVKLRPGIAFAALLLMVLSIWSGHGKTMLVLGCTYTVMFLAYWRSLRLNNFARYGDMSYGVYIYAFPVQQTLAYYSGGRMSQMTNFLAAVPITVVLAFASWHLVEKRCMKLKNAFFGGPKRSRSMEGQ